MMRLKTAIFLLHNFVILRYYYFLVIGFIAPDLMLIKRLIEYQYLTLHPAGRFFKVFIFNF